MNEGTVERVRSAIAESGMSQQRMASVIGMDPTALSKVLNGKRQLSSLEYALISEQTGRSVMWLLDRDQEDFALRAFEAIRERIAADDCPMHIAADIEQIICEIGAGWDS